LHQREFCAELQFAALKDEESTIARDIKRWSHRPPPMDVEPEVF
jgi:hypothetical protein